MINILINSNCCGCGACQQICPKGCIAMQEDAEGFLYPKVDMSCCIECNLCEKVCPIVFNKAVSKQETPKVYAAFIKHDEIRLESSSGGVFSLLAEWVLDQNGIVFGAAFAKDFSVHHIRIESKQDLYKLRGSKYVQSRTENTYNETKNALEQGKMVLYSGVGCQIAGLKTFLRKKYLNLFTVDVLCHGVPLPKLWKSYLSQTNLHNISQISFRSKQNGWHDFASKIQFVNGKDYCKHHNEDQFMRLFLNNLCLRPSCHSCHFREGRSGADITLGDAWGIEKWMPEMDDDKGTSVVFVNSPKGLKMWNDIQTQVVAKNADLETVVKYNLAYRKSVKPHPNRKKFFAALNENAPIEQLVKLTRKPLWNRVFSFGKRCVKKLFGK